MFDRLALRFNGRIHFIKDAIGPSEICCWRFYGNGKKFAEVCCTSIVYATDRKHTKVNTKGIAFQKLFVTNCHMHVIQPNSLFYGLFFKHRLSFLKPEFMKRLWIHFCTKITPDRTKNWCVPHRSVASLAWVASALPVALQMRRRTGGIITAHLTWLRVFLIDNL